MDLKKLKDSEINILDTILIIWNNKLKIFIISGVILILSIIFHLTQNNAPNRLLVTTKFKPISNSEELDYIAYNEFLGKFNQNVSNNENQIDKNINISSEIITKDYLMELFVDKMDNGEIFKNAIMKHNFINKEDYPNTESHELRVNQLAFKIKFTVPKEEFSEYIIKFEIPSDAKKNWINSLKYIENQINEEIRRSLISANDKIISNINKKQKYKIEDINILIEAEKKKYSDLTKKKLAFLNEQSQIARKLNIKNQYDEDELSKVSLGAESGNIFSPNISDQSLYFVRGYEAIEKEMELIKKRGDPKLYNEDLILLENKKIMVKLNKDVNRFKNLFQETPVHSNNFYAAKIIHSSSKFRLINSQMKFKTFIVFACVISLILSSMFVLIVNLTKNRNKI